MRRLAAAFAIVSICALGGCNTYQQDLKRAEAHYTENRYENALALFRVLEPDIDSLTPGDQARYAYLRGMTDFRLAALASPGGGASDPRKMFRINARHWLAVAAATEKATPGGLTADERTRMDEALNELNREVYGGAEALGDAPAGSSTPATTAAPSAAPAAGPSPSGQPSMGTMPANPK